MLDVAIKVTHVSVEIQIKSTQYDTAHLVINSHPRSIEHQSIIVFFLLRSLTFTTAAEIGNVPSRPAMTTSRASICRVELLSNTKIYLLDLDSSHSRHGLIRTFHTIES